MSKDARDGPKVRRTTLIDEPILSGRRHRFGKIEHQPAKEPANFTAREGGGETIALAMDSHRRVLILWPKW